MDSDNITLTEKVELEPVVVENTKEPTLADLITAGDLTKIRITDENISLNVIVAFLNYASRKGVFSIEENAKIWECIQFFIQQPNKA